VSAFPNRTRAVFDVLSERDRHVAKENWSHEHDDAHTRGELAEAGACYAINAARSAQGLNAPSCLLRLGPSEPPFHLWPWDMSWWKPRSAREDLVRAAALIIAEIERIDRAAD
jgi:hypothetical protein